MRTARSRPSATASPWSCSTRWPPRSASTRSPSPITTARRRWCATWCGSGTGHRAARALLALAPRPTAIFAANDSMAIGAMSALHEAGLRVPEDVAVVGFDDIPTARCITPPLTSVHVDIGDLGRRATTRLLELLAESPTPPRRETVPATLVVRGSCGGIPSTTPTGG